MSLRHDLGRAIRRHRQRVGLTQAELAERVGISTQSIGKMERGVSAPSLDTLEVLAQTLARPVGDFFAEAPPPSSRPELDRICARLAAAPPEDLPWIGEMLTVALKRGR